MTNLPEVDSIKGVLIVFIAGAMAAVLFYVASKTFLPKAEGYIAEIGAPPNPNVPAKVLA